MWDGCSGLRTTKIAQQNVFVEHNASAGRSGCVTGPGRGTGAAARRGHDDVRRAIISYTYAARLHTWRPLRTPPHRLQSVPV
jgi:hypothetical protein